MCLNDINGIKAISFISISVRSYWWLQLIEYRAQKAYTSSCDQKIVSTIFAKVFFSLDFPLYQSVNTHKHKHKKRFATLIDDHRETRFLPVFDSVLFDVLGTVSIVDFDGSQWNNWKIDQDQHFYGISFNCFFSFGQFRTESTKYSLSISHTLCMHACICME